MIFCFKIIWYHLRCTGCFRPSLKHLLQWMIFWCLKRKKPIKTENFELFQHILLDFKIIWMRIGQVRLQKDSNFFETPGIILLYWSTTSNNISRIFNSFKEKISRYIWISQFSMCTGSNHWLLFYWIFLYSIQQSKYNIQTNKLLLHL